MVCGRCFAAEKESVINSSVFFIVRLHWYPGPEMQRISWTVLLVTMFFFRSDLSAVVWFGSGGSGAGSGLGGGMFSSSLHRELCDGTV